MYTTKSQVLAAQVYYMSPRTRKSGATRTSISETPIQGESIPAPNGLRYEIVKGKRRSMTSLPWRVR